MTTFSVQTFTEGKIAGKNEDAVLYNDTTVALSDGVTDRNGLIFGDKSGGEIASRIVTETALASHSIGKELVDEVTEKIAEFYKEHSPEALEDSAYRIGATLLVARIVGDQLIVTQVSDSAFRINGKDEHHQDSLIDVLTSGMRRTYIEATGDVEGSRDVILPTIKNQHIYQNNTQHPLGFGVIDGTSVPEEFIKTLSFPLSDVQTVEMATDGYYGVFPDEVSLEAYEKLYAHIQSVDPHKFKEYASTKEKDDRTVAIVHLS